MDEEKLKKVLEEVSKDKSGADYLSNLALFDEYSSDEENDFFKFKLLCRERKYTVKDVGVSYRIISNWKEKEVLPESCFNKKGQEWAKFNLTELLWIKLVSLLRSFGTSLDVIKTVREQLLLYDKESDSYPIFEFKILLSVATTDDLFLCIQPEGGVSIAKIDFIVNMRNFLMGIEKNFPPLIIISFKDLIKNHFKFVEKAEKVFLISENEERILNKIRGKNVKEINIRKKNGGVLNIDTTEITQDQDLDVIKEKAKRERMFGKISLNFEDGTGHFVEVKRSEKLS